MRIVNEPETIDGIRVVQDSEEIADALRNGEPVYHWEAGDSMTPLINHMEYCRIEPIRRFGTVNRGDAVFCKMKDQHTGQEYYMVHQVWEISHCGHDGRYWYKIGSTGTTVFGWTDEVLGKAFGTDIFQEVTQEIRDEWEAERLERMRAFEATSNP
jgi:hypothetical protein